MQKQRRKQASGETALVKSSFDSFDQRKNATKAAGSQQSIFKENLNIRNFGNFLSRHEFFARDKNGERPKHLSGWSWVSTCVEKTALSCLSNGKLFTRVFHNTTLESVWKMLSRLNIFVFANRASFDAVDRLYFRSQI